MLIDAEDELDAMSILRQHIIDRSIEDQVFENAEEERIYKTNLFNSNRGEHWVCRVIKIKFDQPNFSRQDLAILHYALLRMLHISWKILAPRP